MGVFYDKNSDCVSINGVSIPREVFMLLEPDYNELRGGIVRLRYDSNARRLETWDSTGRYITQDINWQKGNSYINRLELYQKTINNSANQDTEIARRIAEVRAIQSGREPSYFDLRKASYPSTDELIVALWEKIVEGRDERANELQEKREEIKKRYMPQVKAAITQTKKKVARKKTTRKKKS